MVITKKNLLFRSFWKKKVAKFTERNVKKFQTRAPNPWLL
jgi:hypothetical protein